MAKSIVCKKCGTVYSSAQTVCPKCMTRRPRTNEKIIAGVAIFFIAVGLLCILGGILGDDETTPSQNVSTDSSQVDSTDNNASRISAERNGTQYYNIGDTLDANGLKITLNEISDWNSDNMFIQPKDGYKYIRAYFIMKNTNKTDRLLGSYDFSCYADDAKWKVLITVTIRLASAIFRAERIYRGMYILKFPKTLKNRNRVRNELVDGRKSIF